MSCKIILIIGAVAVPLHGCLDAFLTDVYVMGCRTVAGAVENVLSAVAADSTGLILILKTADVICSLGVQLVHGINSLSVMDINGVEFFCKINVIITAASDRTDLLHAAVILKDSHKTGKSTFYRSLVNDTGFLDTGLGAGIINVVQHDCHGALRSHFSINQTAGELASYLSIGGQGLSLGAALLCCCSFSSLTAVTGGIHA